MLKQTNSHYIQLDIPADHRFLSILGASLNALIERVGGLSEEEDLAYSMELALHETCANIVEHAYGDQPGRIQVRISIHKQDGEVVFDVKDEGRAFDPATVGEPDLAAVPTRGYGLYLVRNLMDEIGYRREGKTNYWRLTKKV